ncbi:MAG: hypothetical protein U0441_05845 [Polyangiaceae bacterium]
MAGLFRRPSSLSSAFLVTGRADLLFVAGVSLVLLDRLDRVGAEDVDRVVGAVESCRACADALLRDDLGHLEVVAALQVHHRQRVEGAGPDAPLAPDARLKIHVRAGRAAGFQHLQRLPVVVDGLVRAHDAASAAPDAEPPGSITCRSLRSPLIASVGQRFAQAVQPVQFSVMM